MSVPVATIASVEDAAEACAREPIRIPGRIQPHGALLVLDPASCTILQASANARALFAIEHDLLGATLESLEGFAELRSQLEAWMAGRQPQLLVGWSRAGASWQISAHRNQQGLIVEFERDERPPGRDLMATLNSVLRQFVADIEILEDVRAIQHAAARQVQELTGFNRVMVYQFDPDWHGTVMAEVNDGTLPSYLDLRFPATDIPAQARALYLLNRLRLIASSDYLPVPLEPERSPVDGEPLDLSQSVLRSVAPVHLEYMRNMGTGSSMSTSIVVDGQLWGLISCHHREPRHVDAPVRAACDFLSHIVSMQIGARERSAYASRRIELKRIETELVAHLSRAASFQEGLVEQPELWMRVAGATGAAVALGGSIQLVGQTPDLEQVEALGTWLQQTQRGESVFASDHLSALHPPAAAFVDVASGVIAVAISQLHAGYVMWFRPEVIRTVTWGGDPSKSVDPSSGRLAPRHSFDLWKELLKGRSQPWDRSEIDAASDLRNSIVNFVLRRAEERASLTEQLERSNKELESFSYSVSHDLRAPFRHIVGYARLLKDREKGLDAKSQHYVGSIVDSALAAGNLVDDLLHFSQLGRSSLNTARVDMNKLVAESIRALSHDTRDRKIDWHIGPLPPSFGDASLLRQTVTNLIGNSIKYSAVRDPAVIRISGEQREHETVYTFADNGVGFDMAYVGKLFGVFQRLHRAEEYEGTGIGLALARRIIDRHGGWIQADGEVDVGATFRIGLPRLAVPDSSTVIATTPP